MHELTARIASSVTRACIRVFSAGVCILRGDVPLLATMHGWREVSVAPSAMLVLPGPWLGDAGGRCADPGS